MRPARALSFVVLAAFLPVSVAHAQPAKPVTKAGPTASAAPPAVPATTNDIVRLKSGTSFRGALVEHDPKGRTLLQTDQGTRDFDSNDVAYAGPAAGDTGPGGTAPPPPPSVTPPAPQTGPAPTAAPLAAPLAASPTPAAPAVTAPAVTGDVVQLNAAVPGVQFHVLGGPSGARALCAAPCSTQLPPGSYRMALSKGLDTPHPVAGDVEVRANGTLEASYANNKASRVGGVLLIVGGAIVAVAGLGGLTGSGTDSKALGGAAFLLGGGGVVGGVFLVRRQDEASIRSAESDRVAPRTGIAPMSAAPAYGSALGGRF